MYQVQITRSAELDLQEAVRYIRDTLHNPTAAQRLLDDAEKELSSLSVFPDRNALVHDSFLAANGVRLQMIHNYLALYVIREQTKTVVILRIVYGRRDWISLLKAEL